MMQEEIPRHKIENMLKALNDAHKAYHYDGRTQEARIVAKRELNSCKKWFQDRGIPFYFNNGYKPQWMLDPTYLKEQDTL